MPSTSRTHTDPSPPGATCKGRVTNPVCIVFDRDRRVTLHQDFRDAAGGFHEHLPLLGGLIRGIRRRL